MIKRINYLIYGMSSINTSVSQCDALMSHCVIYQGGNCRSTKKQHSHESFSCGSGEI